MRPFLITIANLCALLWSIALLPLRAMRSRHRPAWIRFRISGDVPYRVPLSQRWWRRRGDPASVRSLQEFGRNLDELAKDARVRGILLEVGSATLPPAKVTSLHQMLSRFRERSKQVVGWTILAGNTEYEILCAADRIFLPRGGRLELTGFAIEATALGDALSQLGVTPEFVRRGDYKTAPELFTHATISKAQREMLDAILDERYEALVARIGQGRKMATDRARQAIDGGPYSAKRAVALGLCDAVVEELDVLPQLLGGEKSEASSHLPVATFRTYRSSRPWRPALRSWRRRPLVAVVPIEGMLTHGEGGSVPGLSGRMTGSESAARALRSAASDPRAAAVLLHMSSPGGSASASELILEEVRRVAQRKPLVAYVDRVAASGGYLAAMAARELWADPHALVGSIGVYAGKFDLSRLLERIGIERAVLSRGAQAGRFSLSRPFTAPERAALEAEVEEIYQEFLEEVARSRRQSVDEVRTKAEGRVFSGQRALAAGLVDRLGSFEDAARRALELAGRSEESFELSVHRPSGRGLELRTLFERAVRWDVYALWVPGWSGSILP